MTVGAWWIFGYISNALFPPQAAVTLAIEPACEIATFAADSAVEISTASRRGKPAHHCRVRGTIDKEINFELLLPTLWNGKFVMGGGGGFVGTVENIALRYGALQSGYATVGTDTGHSGNSLDARWALDNMVRIENFGHRAVHLTTVAAKGLIATYYGQASRQNYFMGCSRGGGQALMEAQRYPEDFDGIVAGAPAYNWSLGVAANATQIARAMFPDPNRLERAVIQPEDQALIAEAYLQQCDSLDGLRDGILNDPRDCPFTPEALRCRTPGAAECLSEEKISALASIYGGPSNVRGQLWPGFPFGGELSEQGMTMWLTGGLAHLDLQPGALDEYGFPYPLAPNASYAFGNGIMKYMVFNDPAWDYRHYNYDQVEKDTAPIAKLLDAADPNLDAFRRRGGKLLLYHGWSDMALSAHGTIDYYDRVVERSADAATDVKLYLLPGVDHCFGGVGPSLINYLTVIDQWVERKQEPAGLEAHWLNWMRIPWGSRLVCPYPQRPIFLGASDSSADSFRCEWLDL
ncbi:MAG: tannase/feruloyl esterase family alpha/beta hydrolase [Pseudomonadota bacterium]